MAKKKKKIVRKKYWIQDWIESLLFAFVVAMIIRNYTFQNFKIPSGSMESTLLVGDYLVANKMKYYLTEPQRGDIVTFRYPADPEEPEPRENYIKLIPPIYWSKSNFFFAYHEKKNVVKRVIGMPGDVVEMRNKRVYINGDFLQEDYVQYLDRRIGQPLYGYRNQSLSNDRDNFGPLVVPDGKYLVLGDNRDFSADSRHWGFLKREDITGTPALIFFSVGESIRWDRIFQIIR